MTDITVRESFNKYAKAWREFRRDNPDVYDLIRTMAMQMLVRKRRFGVKMLVEAVRWEIKRSWSKDVSGFKLNNNHTAYIARDLVLDFPELADLIEVRHVLEGD